MQGYRPLIPAPDVLLVSAVWPERALLRAQLIEEGWTVAAYESWSDAAPWLSGTAVPKVAVIETGDLPDAEAIVTTLVAALGPARVIALTSARGVPRDALELAGAGTVIARPYRLADIVAAVRRATASHSPHI